MTEDERPRPQYGEYATPEQQAAAMGRSIPPPLPPQYPDLRVPTVAQPGDTLPPAAIARPRGYANRFLTVLLLIFGALSMFENIPALLDLAATLKGAFTTEQLTTVTVPASVDAAGVPIIVANVAIYLATLLVSILVMRRGHVSFYIPILGWLLFVAATAVLIVVYAPGLVSQFGS